MPSAPMLTNAAELQALLRWNDVREETPFPGSRMFTVRPASEMLPFIAFYFDDDVTCLQALAFDRWHGHFERWQQNERRNVREAIAMARTLIAGDRCVFIERDAAGELLCASALRRTEMPLKLQKGFARLERIAFNAPPADVPVDLTRYHKMKDGSYLEHGWRRKVIELYGRLGNDPSAWD